MLRLASMLLALLAFGAPQALALDEIRIYKDGAGPSHIFWLSGPSKNYPDQDIVGILDPLLSAVRLYALQRGPVRGEQAPGPIKERLKLIGACGLPVTFRAWRLHHLKNEVRIESMPDPGAKRYEATRGDFFTDAYAVPRNLVAATRPAALAAAGNAIDKLGWNPAAEGTPQCGRITVTGGALGLAAPFAAERDANRQGGQVFVLTNEEAALSGKRRLVIDARASRLENVVSVRELEPSQSGPVVQVTERLKSTDGMIRMRQKLLLFPARGAGRPRTITFDDTFIRRKIGLKPLAVMPGGEILAMGRQSTGTDGERKFFRIQSCGHIGSRIRAELCTDDADTVSSQVPADTSIHTEVAMRSAEGAQAVDVPQRVETAASIFTGKRGAANMSVADLAEFRWQVDAARLPKDCRTIVGCKPANQDVNFIPLPGVRLSFGAYSQKGLPYAQTDSLADYDRFFEGAKLGKFDEALGSVTNSQGWVPGNLEDKFTGEVGIDCSALVQVAWNGRKSNPLDRLSTHQLQTDKNLTGKVSYRCPDRLADPTLLRAGDAISISLDGVGEHVVLYAATVRLDGASEFWLVLESSSSCGGVCWSIYDPSYFSGWGLYRAANRRDLSCPPPNPTATSIASAPFPTTFKAWCEKVSPRSAGKCPAQ